VEEMAGIRRDSSDEVSQQITAKAALLNLSVSWARNHLLLSGQRIFLYAKDCKGGPTL
jgi:hypothetical protein